MANVTIPGLSTTLTSVDRAADLFEVSDTSDSGNSKKTTVNYALDLTSHPVGVDDVQTLTNKTLTSPTINTPTLAVNDNVFTIRDNSDTTKIVDFQLSGLTTGNTRTLTVPDASLTLVGTATTQTLTNKTLTSPTITNPTLTVDTVSEHTAANGVTIDGLNIKDSALNTNNSVPNNAWNNTGTFGSSWAWTSWTPTWTNLTVGNGTNSSKYTQVGKLIIARVAFLFGSTSSISGGISFTLPVTSVSYTEGGFYGRGVLRDAGTAEYACLLDISTTTQAIVYAEGAAGSYVNATALSSTIPFTWTTNDHISGILIYEAA